MFELLQNFAVRPKPFSCYTTKQLWTDPHISGQMLQAHLDPEFGLASRPPLSIESTVDWIDSKLNLKNKNLCDLGCGPGLYATRFHEKGASVIGLDFSQRSLDYAEARAKEAGQSITYMVADYTENELPANMDILTLIYYDFCALSSMQRHSLLTKIRAALVPGGHLVMDLYALPEFDLYETHDLIEDRLMDGFWAEGDYLGLKKSFRYENEKVTLERYLIVEPDKHWEIYNWLQYFSPQSVEDELNKAGFTLEVLASSLEGDPYTEQSRSMGIVAIAS